MNDGFQVDSRTSHAQCMYGVPDLNTSRFEDRVQKHAPTIFAQPFHRNPHRDLLAHDDLENEWWYYHGRLASGARQFGFHLAFFRRRTDRVRLAQVFPIRLGWDQIRFAHFGLADIDRRLFRYAHQRSLTSDAGASAERFLVWLRNWRAEESDGVHHIRAVIRNTEINLQLDPVKSLIRHGADGSFPKCDGCQSTYVSFPRMKASGRITIDEEVVPVTGEAWMDREFGDFRFTDELSGWDWVALQFDDYRELVVYRLRDSRGRQTDYSMAAIIDREGETVRLDADQFSLIPVGQWTSKRTGIVYPLRWSFRSDRFDTHIDIRPLIRCCELDTRGSTNVIYWEGPVESHGKVLGQTTAGKGYLELAGYGTNHVAIGQYDFTADNLGLFDWIANEFRLRWHGWDVTALD